MAVATRWAPAAAVWSVEAIAPAIAGPRLSLVAGLESAAALLAGAALAANRHLAAEAARSLPRPAGDSHRCHPAADWL